MENVPGFSAVSEDFKNFRPPYGSREFFCNIFSSIMKISYRIDNFSETIDF